MSAIRVLIVDDSFIVRAGLRNVVEALAGVQVVGEAASGHEAVARARDLRPDIVLMDVRMRDGDGIAATREIAAELPDTRTLVVSWSDEPDHIRDAIAAGAKGYLVHGRFGAAELESALRQTDAVRPPTAEDARLTPREQEILALVRRGRRNREIAAALGVEEKTVKNHLNSIYSKLELAGRIEAMATAPGSTPKRRPADP